MRRRTVLRRAGVAATAALAGCVGHGGTGGPEDDTTTRDDGPDERPAPGDGADARGLGEYHGWTAPLDAGVDCGHDPREAASDVVFVTDTRKYLLTGAAASGVGDLESVPPPGECATVFGYAETPPAGDDGCTATVRSLHRLVAYDYLVADDTCTA